MIVGFRCAAILKQKIPLKAGFFVFYCRLFLRSIITAKHIHDLILIEEGFPSRG